MKKDTKHKALLLEQLSKTPIVQIACEKTGISRMTFYRWRKENQEFSEAVDMAMSEGNKMINDLAESQLVGAIKSGNIPATTYWLRNKHPDYKTKVDITNHIVRDTSTSSDEDQLVDQFIVAQEENAPTKDEKESIEATDS